MKNQKVNIYNFTKAVREIGFSRLSVQFRGFFLDYVMRTMWGQDFSQMDINEETRTEILQVIDEFNRYVSRHNLLKNWPEKSLTKVTGHITEENFMRSTAAIDFDLLPGWIRDWYYKYRYLITFNDTKSPSNLHWAIDQNNVKGEQFMDAVKKLVRYGQIYGGLPRKMYSGDILSGGSDRKENDPLKIKSEKVTLFNFPDVYHQLKKEEFPFQLDDLHKLYYENTNYGNDVTLLMTNPVALHAIESMLNFLIDKSSSIKDLPDWPLVKDKKDWSVTDVIELASLIDTARFPDQLQKQIELISFAAEFTPVFDAESLAEDLEQALAGVAKQLTEIMRVLGGVPLKKQKQHLQGIKKQKIVDWETPATNVLYNAWRISKNDWNNREDLYEFLTGLQKEIIEEKIRKTDPDAKHIMTIQRELIDFLNKAPMGTRFAFSEQIESYLGTINDRYNVSSVRFTLKTIADQNGVSPKNAQKKNTLKSLLDSVNELIRSKSYEKTGVQQQHLKKVKSALEKSLKSGTIFTVPQFDLAGLLGEITTSDSDVTQDMNGLPLAEESEEKFLFGIESAEQAEKYPSVMSAAQMASLKVETMPFSGILKEAFGEPERCFTLMLYGPPGSGKSILSLYAAKQIAQNIGNVLYVAAEQYPKGSLTDKIVRMQADKVAGLDFAGNIFDPEVRLELYDVIFIDSVNYQKITPQQFRQLQKTYPGKAFVLILQVRKDGHFKGSQDWGHDPDIVANVKDRKLEVEKNRYGDTKTVELPDLLPEAENPVANDGSISAQSQQSELSGTADKSLFGRFPKLKSLLGQKGKQQSITATLTFSLEDLAEILLSEEEDFKNIFEQLDSNPGGAEERIKSIVRDYIASEKIQVSIGRVWIASIENGRKKDGLVHFNAKLKGSSSELKKIAGEGQFFDYDWDNPDPEN